MLKTYIQTAMHAARYEILEDDGTFYGEIPECRGVFANAETLEGCREQLEEVLEDWIPSAPLGRRGLADRRRLSSVAPGG